MNRSSHEQRVRILLCLINGRSTRETVAITGAAKNTVAKLRRDLGADTVLQAPTRGLGYTVPADPATALADLAVGLLERTEDYARYTARRDRRCGVASS
jgi:hypothetical protein